MRQCPEQIVQVFSFTIFNHKVKYRLNKYRIQEASKKFWNGLSSGFQINLYEGKVVLSQDLLELAFIQERKRLAVL